MQLSEGLNTSHSHTRRLCVEGTSCPSGTRCLDESNFVQNERKRRVPLFRDDNLDLAFSSQNVDADVLRMAFKREVNYGVSNPEILHLNVFQEGWQNRLGERQAGPRGLNAQTEAGLEQQEHGDRGPRLRTTGNRVQRR